MKNENIINKFNRNGYTVIQSTTKIWTVTKGSIAFGSSTNLYELYRFLKHRLPL